MSIAASSLLLPAPDATWRLWKPRATSAALSVDSSGQIQLKGKPLVIGLPATACRSIGLTLPNADHELLEQIIITQLERRGLKLVGGTGRNFRWHLLSQTASSATVSVDVLADPFPEDLAIPQASDYTAALRLANLPVGSIVVTEEQGTLVLAIGHQGRLYQSLIISPTTSIAPEALAVEVNLARMAFESELGEGMVNSLVLSGSPLDSSLLGALEQMTGLSVRSSGPLTHNPDLDTHSWPKLLPAVVREAQAQAARRSKLARFGLWGGLMMVSLAFLAFAYLRFQEMQAAQLQTDVDATAAPAAQVRKTADIWKALAPAIEPKRYPMVLLAEITKLMPPSGLVIRRFHLKDNSIDLQGEARDAQTAVQFMEDLQKHPMLGRYQWSKPSPNVRDGAAQFRTEGKAQ